MYILVVVVRYKFALENSQTITSLSEAIRPHPDLLSKIAVLIWDNSPIPVENLQLPFPCDYRHTGENLGVSGAYNRALEIAEQQGSSWMVLLDQDTTLPGEFLTKVIEQARFHEGNGQIAAIVPFLIDGKLPSSPVAVLCGRNKVISPPFDGVYPKEIFAANSGAVMRVASLRSVGGYNEDFWLDLSDVVLFHKLHAQGKRVHIAGDLQLQHRITNNDYDGSMSPQRYCNFIAAEGAYWDLYRGWVSRTIYTARLFGRVFRQYRRHRNKIYSKLTWNYLCQRLTTRRQRRSEIWRRQSMNRNLPAIWEGKVIG